MSFPAFSSNVTYVITHFLWKTQLGRFWPSCQNTLVEVYSLITSAETDPRQLWVERPHRVCWDVPLTVQDAFAGKDNLLSLVLNPPSLHLRPFRVLHASSQEVAAVESVLFGEFPKVAHVGAGDKIKTVHRDAFPLQRVHKELDVPVSDHLVGRGVQVEVRPGGRPLPDRVVVVPVDVFGERIQDDPQHKHSHRKDGDQRRPQHRAYVGAQGGIQGPHGPADVPAARSAVHDSPDHAQGAKLLISVQQVHDVAVQHEAPIAEDVEENWTVLHLVVVQDLQQLQGSVLQLLVAKRLWDKDCLQGSRVADGYAPLKGSKESRFLFHSKIRVFLFKR